MDNSSDQEPDVGHQAKAKVKPKPRGKAKGQSKAKGKLPAEWRDVGDEDEENIPLRRQQAKVKPRPRGKSQGKRPSEWRGIRASDGSAEDDADNNEDIPSNDPLMAKGPLPKSVKNEIDTAHAKFKAEIAAIAHKSGRELQSCYNYLDANNQIPRAANCFNIPQIWYGVHGKKRHKPGVTASKWTKIVTKEYYAFLQNNLSEGEFHNNEAHRHVLKEQFEWYETNMENFIEAKKKKGKVSNSLQKIMRPFIALAEKIHIETGYHIGGYAIHEDHKPLTWVVTTDLQKI
ncbi:hypothetical protein BT96DRAFT_946766 [Gymnopus androsaceus JB14]|uniref:Uncharacterized protein n=1 Tax=Gymnopus androsaceus JB14 TaxID=1447944 RepID=A0A6A4GUX6_9AGAR|nr:hypothetical protein BT96DRAFT_946766 [Gymnopus androsaceus JB14]